MEDTFTVAVPKRGKLNKDILGDLAEGMGYRSRGAFIADLINRSYAEQIEALFIVRQVFPARNGEAHERTA